MDTFTKRIGERVPTTKDADSLNLGLNTPQILSSMRSEGGRSHVMEIYNRGIVSTIEAPIIDKRRALSEILSEELVDIVLGEKKITGDRITVLAEISRQYRARRRQGVGALAVRSSNAR